VAWLDEVVPKKMVELELEEQIRTHAEVVGDVGVLVAFLKQMDMPKILDGHIKRHHLDQGLSWG
jgi:hypothetical protein